MSSVWETLSAIDCKAHIEKKGQFSYLAWTWAWAMVKQSYPRAHYHIMEDITYPDGTMEVRVEVVIPEEADKNNHPIAALGAPPVSLSHIMWLPVLNHQNKAISNPNAFDINSARMRCLVKCLAMFGLGHYIYAGESAPQAPTVEFTPEQKAQYIKIMAEGDSWGMKQFADTVGGEVMALLFNASPKGEITKQKEMARGLVMAANSDLKKYLAAIDEAIMEGATDQINEIFLELTEIEAQYVNRGLTEVQHQQIKQLKENAA